MTTDDITDRLKVLEQENYQLDDAIKLLDQQIETAEDQFRDLLRQKWAKVRQLGTIRAEADQLRRSLFFQGIKLTD